MNQYTHGHAPAVLASHGTRTAADSAAYLLPHLAQGMAVLDVGCGPGTITSDLARSVFPGVVVGVDPSEDAIRVATDHAREQQVHNVHFATGDVYDLPFEDDRFDVVHAHQVLQHLPDPVAALKSMSRMCKPGGLIAVRDADYGSMSWFPPSEGLDRWLSVYRTMAQGNGGEPQAGKHLRSWARKAGLRDVRISASTWHYSSAESARWWGESWAQRVRTTSYGARAVELGLATEEDIGMISAAWRDWSRDPDAWFAMIHCEILARPAPGTAMSGSPTDT